MTRRDGSTGWLGLVTMLGLAIALQPVPASAEQTTLVVFNVTNLVGSPSAGSFTIEVHPVRTDSPPARTHLPHTHTHTHNRCQPDNAGGAFRSGHRRVPLAS